AKRATAQETFGPLSITTTGDIIGTPLYMSPEQTRGQEPLPQSDMYSLGCVLFQCVTGSPPFQGESAFETIRMHQEAPTPKLQSLAEQTLPSSLIALVNRLLEKEPASRFDSMDQVKEALRTAFDEEPVRINRQSATAKILIPGLLLVSAGLLYGLINGLPWADFGKREQPVLSKKTHKFVVRLPNFADLHLDRAKSAGARNLVSKGEEEKTHSETSQAAFTANQIIKRSIAHPYRKKVDLRFCSDLFPGLLRQLRGVPVDELDLSRTTANDQTLEELSGCTIRKLNLNDDKISSLVLIKKIIGLKELHLDRTDVDDADMRTIEGLGITHLTLNSCRGITRLDFINKLPQLKHLEVKHTNISGYALDQLNNRSLQVIYLDRNHLPFSSISSLVSRLNNLTVARLTDPKGPAFKCPQVESLKKRFPFTSIDGARMADISTFSQAKDKGDYSDERKHVTEQISRYANRAPDSSLNFFEGARLNALRNGKPEEAEFYLQHELKIAKDSQDPVIASKLNILEAEVALNKKNWKKAEEEARKYIHRLGEANPKGYHDIAHLYSRLRQREKAIEYLLKEVEFERSEPELMKAEHRLATWYKGLENYGKCREFATRIVRKVRNLPKAGSREKQCLIDSLDFLGDISLREQKYSEAVSHYQRLLSALPRQTDDVRSINTKIHLMNAYRMAGEEQQSQEVATDLIDNDLKQDWVLDHRAYGTWFAQVCAAQASLCFHRRDFENALKWNERGLEKMQTKTLVLQRKRLLEALREQRKKQKEGR
ncbi:MAG: hypothetical protein K2Z81_15335, partial [Cyanobacteria bacterium]|nr:hypothetical protein [Cyanobacteriota bacterium]